MEKKLEKEKFVNNKQAADDRIAIIVISSISANLFKRNIMLGVQKREFYREIFPFSTVAGLENEGRLFY